MPKTSSIGFTVVKNTACLPLLRLSPPGINPFLTKLNSNHSSVPDVVQVLGESILSETEHCLAIQDQQHCLLNVLELLEITGIDWKSLDSSNIETFSQLLLLLPEWISNLQVAIAKRHLTSSSCTLR